MDPAADRKAAKAALRAEVLARRAAIPEEERRAAAASLAEAAEHLPIPAGASVAGFLAIRGEIDPLPLLLALHARGHTLSLPVVLADRTTMLLRAWTPGEPLEPSSFGLSVPPASAAVVEPDVLLVPLAAFDRHGYRIGYGKGHYDRALARLQATRPRLKIGVAFALQEIAEVPHEAHDEPLDHVLTERGLVRAEAGGRRP
jgi:5-formyltetrahydrofolate cyclo-ligase